MTRKPTHGDETMTITLKIGQAYMFGDGDDAERGVVDAIVGDRVTIRWEQGIVTTQNREALVVTRVTQ